MSKGVKLMAAALLITASASAQEVNTDTISASDEFDFSLTEGQIDESAEAASTVTLVSSSKDPYMNEVGYKWSSMRFKYRSLDNAYVGNYINGAKFNNVENGRFSFSGITGGLNDATRNKTGASFLEQNTFAYSPLGGVTDIDIRASHYSAGHKVGIAGTNRNYVLRTNYTFATGLMNNGWALMGSLAYRWAQEGNIEGTFYNSFSFMLGAEKKINNQHSIAFNIWGAPTERGQQGAATEEAYALAGSHYYNPYWGYQNGQKRNSRVVTEFSPSFLATWDWKIDEQTKLTTTAALTWMNYASSALSYNNAYNPSPNYYKNLPSSVFNVYSDEYNSEEWLGENPGVLNTWQNLYDYWTSDKANRQVKWDLMYAQNEANNATGKSALYYLEKRHNNQLAFNFASFLNGKFNTHGSYTLGVNVNSTKGMHYKTMADLLGATTFMDYDNYSLNKYGSNSVEYQNDLDNPNHSIGVGDKFGYNYNIYVNKLKAYATNVWKFDYDFTLTYGADIEGTWIEREGLMRNGRAANYSKGKSGVAKFLGGGGKLMLQKQIATSFIYIGGSIESSAPLAYNSFAAPRIQNNFVNGLKNEWYWNGEAGYQWYFGPVSGKVSAYYTRMNDLTQQTAFYNDDASYLTYLSMTGIQQEYKGIEAALSIKLARNLKLNILGTISDAKYVNNPYAELSYEGSDASTVKFINAFPNKVTGLNNPLMVFMKNVKIDSTPLTAATVGLSYNTNGWYLDLDLNYFDRVYVGASRYLRLSNSVEGGVTGYSSIIQDTNINGGYTTAWDYARQQAENGHAAYVYDEFTGEVIEGYSPTQEKFKGGFMLDASIGKSINLQGGQRLSVNLQIQNITNNTNMRTGGYEQNRADRSYDYMFSKNNYYYYANGINAFLNVSLKF